MALTVIIAILGFVSFCSASDSRCTTQGGICQEHSVHCSGGYHSGLCDGHASRQCCISSGSQDTACVSSGGHCQENTHHCSGGYQSGLCSGHASRQCCLSSHASGSTSFSSGIVSQTCLNCICKHESGCAPLACAWDVNSDSCGYFQLKQVYWDDCGRPGGTLEQCSRDLHCASQCVQAYMKRYIHYSGCAHNCESYARIHNGGPKGCQHSNTARYWSDIEKLGCSANS